MKPYFTSKIIPLGLAFILLLSVVGLHLDVHYCQGKLVGVSLVSQELSTCCIGGSKNKCHDKPATSNDNSCCQDVETLALLDYDGVVITYARTISPFQALAVAPMIFGAIEEPVYRNALKINPPDPLSISGQMIRIRLLSFLC